jgi:transcription elongation factor GreA
MAKETKQIMLTAKGLADLENELEHLKTVGRKEVAEKIKHARGFGDLSENAEYDEARNEQAQMEARVLQIESILKHAELIDEEEVDINKVAIGSKVKLYDVEFEEEIVYSIVGSTEASPKQGLISDESPVGAALIGKTIGDSVSVETPGGICEYKVLNISKL